MTDNLSKEVRSKIMSSIKGKNTRPEITIRKNLWSMGHRYRIHDRTVFGTPDISNKSRKIAVFIDGCFWHGCKRCYVEPKSNTKFWRDKISRNQERRKKVRRKLRKDGWAVLEFWEHSVKKNPVSVTAKISSRIA